MTLSINSTLNYDEALGFNSTDVDSDTDSNVASLSADLTSAISALNLTYYSSPTNFPQYAEMTDFATTNQSVTSYFLASDSSGDAFSTSTGVGTTLMVGTNEIFLYATSDPNVVVGRVGTGTTADANGAVALVIALGGSAAHPELGVAVYAPISNSGTNLVDDADTLDLSNLIYLGSHYTTSSESDFDSFAGVPSGSDAFAMILPDTANVMQLLVTGLTGSTEEPITISQDANAGSIGGGGGGQHVGPGNSIRIDTITGGDFSKADSSSEDNNFANISYAHHQEIFQASFELVQINPGTAGTTTSLDIFAYDTSTNAQGTSFPTDALANEGTSRTIDPANVHIFNALGVEITPAAGQITSIAGGGVQITGLQLDYTVKFSTPGTQFDRFIITNAQPTKGAGSNVTFDIGHIHVSTLTFGSGTENTELGSHLVFEDGGPSVGLTSATVPTVHVDESALGTPSSGVDMTGLFSISYGPDAQGSSVTYKLGVGSANEDSGLIDTATGQHVLLSYDSGTNTVIGKTATSGDTVLTISVDSTGHVSLDQVRAVVHGTASNGDTSESVAFSASTADALAGLVTLTAKVTDGDGDTASHAANIGAAFSILDDGPSMTGHTLATDDFVQVANTVNASDFNTFTLTPGADGIANPLVFPALSGLGYTIVGPADTTSPWTWAYNDSSHTSITESYTDPSTNVKTAMFSIVLDASTGHYTMTMLHALPFTQLNLDANNIKAGGPTGSIDVGTINDGGDFVQISGLTNTTFDSLAGTLTGTTGAVNASNGNVGVNNGNLDSGEVLEFQLFSSTGTEMGFYGLNMGTKTASSSSYELYGLFHSDGKIHDLGPANSPLAKGGVITYSGTDLLDAIYVKETSGNAVKIGLAGVHLLLPPADVGFHYTAQLTDGDGDYAQLAFNAYIDGDGGGVDHSTVTFA